MEFYRSLLPARESEIYETILNGLRTQAEVISIPLTPSAGVNRMIGSVLADHPELPWASGRWRGKPDFTDMILPCYTMTKEECAAFRQSLNEWKAFTNRFLPLPEIRQIRMLYDEMLATVTYDPAALHSQNAFGALTEKRALCRGIAKGFQLLMEACGIPAICVEGTLDGESLHVWNIVRTESGNYHVDISMGYPQFDFLYTEKGLRYNKYSAFCVSDETLRKTHRWDPEAVPLSCSSDAPSPEQEV